MLLIVALLYLALPPVVATAYVFLWPSVSSRVGLFLVVGSVLGIVIGVAALFWVAQPLVDVGISRAQPGEPSDSLWSLLGSRLLTGALVEISGIYLVLFLLGRWLRPS